MWGSSGVQCSVGMRRGVFQMQGKRERELNRASPVVQEPEIQ